MERTSRKPATGTSTPLVRSTAPRSAAPAPVVTRSRRGITYDYSKLGGGVLEYVFDGRQDHCDGSGTVMTCYGRRPAPVEGPAPRRAPPPPPITPEQIVERTLVNVRLPDPQPEIDPGYAVTGLTAYLETGNTTSHTFAPIDTVLGPLSITATSTYTVDWGDGTVTGPHASNGGPYPNGQITHVYQRTATVDVVVTQHWSARWSLAGHAGTVTGLQSVGALEDFAVREIQAVRRR